MKRLYAAFNLLLVMFPAVSLAASNPQINAAYTAIHEHVCTTLGTAPCPPSLDDDEKWAFVMTWCARRSPGSAETACNTLPTSGGPVVIAFDHDARGWRAIYGVDDRDVNSDANGVPKILTSTRRKVISVVESTNPLVYKAEVGAITETDAEVVSNIKGLFAKLGPALGANFGQAGGLTRESDQVAIGLATTVAKKIECIPDQWIQAREFTQHVEDREDATYTVFAVQAAQNGCPTEPATLDKAFDDLEITSNDLSKINFCSQEVAKLAAWLDMSPSNVKALRDKQKEINLGVDCEERLGEFRTEIDQRLDRLESADTAAAQKPSVANERTLEKQQSIWRDESVADRRDLARLTALTQQATDVVSAATALLTKERRTEIESILANIKKFDRRLIESAATSTVIAGGKFRTKDVADFFVVSQSSIVVAWTKSRSRTLTITKASPFVNISTNRPDSVATSYGAASLAASLVDMSVALTHTDLSSPVFGAVSEAAPTASDPNARRNVIGETDEEARSGKLAVMVAFPIFHRLSDSSWTRRFGLELGAGASTSTPALFLGVTAKLNGGVRLGLGVTRQQVKDLDGQSPGEPISAATDIKLRNVQEESWYASFSITLESIGSLFSAE